MPKEWEELTEEFNAKSPDGRVFHIRVYTKMIDATNMSNGDAPPIQGMKTARTSEGDHCYDIDEDSLKIVELDLIVRRVR
jgi:hypothetical protein